MSKETKKDTKVYEYPSRFGSHSSMVVREDGDSIICKDEFGEYKTERLRLDVGADPNRWDLGKRGVKVE